MSARVWARGRVRVRASAMLRGPTAVGYARNGDYIVLLLQWNLIKLVSFVVGLLVTYSDKY